MPLAVCAGTAVHVTTGDGGEQAIPIGRELGEKALFSDLATAVALPAEDRKSVV